MDGVSRGRLHGWALDRASPFHRLAVEVTVSSGRRHVVLADRYRADVHQSNLGDGYSGFSVPLHRLASSGGVRVTCVDPPAELGAVELPWIPAGKGSKSQHFERGAYTLNVDGPIRPGRLTGWASDRSQPLLRRVLRLSCDGRATAQQRATLYRPDIADGCGDGFHGFAFSLRAEPARVLVVEDIEAGLFFRIRR